MKELNTSAHSYWTKELDDKILIEIQFQFPTKLAQGVHGLRHYYRASMFASTYFLDITEATALQIGQQEHCGGPKQTQQVNHSKLNNNC